MSVEELRDFFKDEMGTTAENGTNINPTSEGVGFLHGKAAFNDMYATETLSTGSGLETTYIDDPSWTNICDCVANGLDVELVLYAYDPETGEQDPLGHMVHVIGCNRTASGELEIVINDPAAPEEDSNNGLGTLTVPVSNGSGLQTGDSFDKGGLKLTHFPLQLDPPRILRIDHLFCEKLIDAP